MDAQGISLLRSHYRGHWLWLTAALVVVWAGSAQAKDLRYYLGTGVGITSTDVDFSKGITYRESGALRATSNPNLVNYSNSASASSVDEGFAFRILAGTRWDLSDTVYAATELTAAWFSDDASGYMAGTLDHDRGPDGGRSVGDVWPGRWELEREYEYGVNLKLGRRIDGMTFLGAERSVYALTGVSRRKLDVTSSFTNESTNSATLAQGSDFHSDKSTAWTIGAGIEFGDPGRHFAIEIFRTEYDIEFHAGGPGLTASTPLLHYDYDVEEWGLSLAYIWGW